MKGYVLKHTKPIKIKKHIDGIGFDTKVFNTIQGIKCHLGGYQYGTKPKKNWKDTLKELYLEIWEVEITPTKKII